MQAWGFRYTTALCWHKTGRRGIGFWLRGEFELLLLGVRGRVPAFRSSLPNVIRAPWDGHSVKPAGVRDLIETLTPGQRRIELFARRPSCAAWTCTGLESDGTDLRAVSRDTGAA
jgi:site-specific DNA-methyltransferase (adenine-specific)